MCTDAAVIIPSYIQIPLPVLSTLQKLLVLLHVTNSSPDPVRKTYLHLNFITVPLLSVLILLATGAINGTVIRDGIVGANGVKPLDIMALFISLVCETNGLIIVSRASMRCI